MLFMADNVTDQLKTKASLRVCSDSKKFNPKNKLKNVFPVHIFELCDKRAFCPASSGVRASVTVEAAMAFSLFLFFLVNLFSLIFLFIEYGEKLENLHQKGKELAVYASVTGGKETKGEDVIRLADWEEVESIFPVLAVPGMKMEVRCVIKPWTGYTVGCRLGREGQEETVFMTEHGEVYHRSRNCTHLAIVVCAKSTSMIDSIRNQEGEKYRPCESCKNEGLGTIVYVTDHGNRYHSFLGCHGLKRTVKGVYYSEIQGVEACSRCG